MLRIIEEEDRIRGLQVAYREARQRSTEDAENLRDELRRVCSGRPASRRVYDLKRRLARALERFRAVEGVAGTADSARVVRLPEQKVVAIFPRFTPRTA